MKKILKALAFLSLVALAAIAAVKLPDWIAAGGKDAGVVVVDDTTDQSGSRSVRTYEDTLKILASGAESTKLFETKSLDQLLKYDESFMKKLEKQGIDGWWLNETGYRWLFGKGNVSDRMVHGALAILAMIFMLSGCYAMERQSGVRFILRCTKKGRKNF